MFKTKNIIILGAVLLVLVGVQYLQRTKHKESTSSSATAVLITDELTAETVGTISLGFGSTQNTVVLANTADGWVIESFFGARANQQRVDSLLRGLNNLAGEFRSDSESVLGDYSLLENQAISVKAADFAGMEIFNILLGQSPVGFTGNFMRLAKSNKVYLSQENQLSQMGVYSGLELPKAQHFLELQAVKENSQDIDSLTMVDDEMTRVFSKKFGTVEPVDGADQTTPASVDRNTWQWLLDGQTTADLAKNKVDAVLNSGVSIRANDLADPTASDSQYGLDNPARKLTLKRQDGSELVLEFGKTREAQDGVTAGTYMRISGKPSIWVVTEYTIKNVFKTLDELKAE